MIDKQQHMLDKQQHMIDKLIDENKKLKQKLDLHLFASSEETVMSTSGRTMIKLFVKRPCAAAGVISSPTFRAHHTGYEAKLELYPKGSWYSSYWFGLNDCWIAKLMPTKGNRDDELSWPFPFRHTITLLDQQTHQDDMKTTVDPATIDDFSWKQYYRKPDTYFSSLERPQIQNFTKSMFQVPESLLLSEKYKKNDTIVMVVEVDC